MSHLRQTHGALLRRHVAAAGADLRQLRDVVLAVLFRFALRQVGPPADAQRQKKRPVSVARQGVAHSKRRRWAGVSLHQQLADVLKLVHVGETLLHQLLDAAAHPHRDHLHAAAGRRQREKRRVSGTTGESVGRARVAFGVSSVRLL